eukprot:15364430-Ditylum_brightwellii.AAC.1
MLRENFTFDDQCQITTDQSPSCSCSEESPENTEDTAKAFDALLKGDMDTVNDEDENKTAVDEDKLDNCWKKPPRSVYFRSLTTDMHASTVSGITENDSPIKLSAAEAAFLKKATTQMDVWEHAAKKRAQEREDTENEISQALEKLENATKASQGKNLTEEIDQL